MRVAQPIPWLLCRKGVRRISHNIPCATELPRVHPHNMDWNKIQIVGSSILVAKSPPATNLKSRHTTKPLAWTDTPLELWNPPEERNSYLNGLFTKGILEEKHSVGTEGSELQQNLGSLRHTLEQGQQCLLRPASATRVSPSVPHCRVPLIFATLLINYMEKQTVAQGCILLTVFSTGNFIIQVSAKENKPRMSINIWSYLAARWMFITLTTILPSSLLQMAL